MALLNVNWFGHSAVERAEVVVARAARKSYFCRHSITVRGVNKTHLLANLSWFVYHPNNTKLSKPLSIWYHDLFEVQGVR